ncbi:MAG TPA: ABC transporter ATP-binding protein, partial [Spirochaetia bacterium]|nr:ABC transporter ATP-binding protein [Spirochaetia bacterium]
EILIQQAMERLFEGRTSFVVAHRLSTIRKADTILVVKDGRIAESGSHEQLLTGGTIYRELYERQYLTPGESRS